MDIEKQQHVQNVIWFTHVKEFNHANFRNLSETRFSTTKWTKQESERQKLYDITYRCNLHMHNHELSEKTNRVTDLNIKFMFITGERNGEGIN